MPIEFNQELIAQALGFFMYMTLESVLGKTRFGSVLGLARAMVWFTFKTIVQKIVSMFKKKGDENGTKSN